MRADGSPLPAVAMLSLVLYCIIYILTGAEGSYMRPSQLPNTTNLRAARVERGSPMSPDDDQHGEKAMQGFSDASNGYYEFIINEGSYKFWSVFQIFTAALLIYSGFAALYFAKYNYEPPNINENEEDILFRRSGDLYESTPVPNGSSLGLNSQTFQRIMDALSPRKYSSS